MDIIYYDDNIIVAIKPAGVISTDEPGGMPSLLRQALGNENADIRTVHRLDQVVSGLMVFAQNPETASELSRQIRAGEFKKTYLPLCAAFLRSAEAAWRIYCCARRSSARPSL